MNNSYTPDEARELVCPFKVVDASTQKAANKVCLGPGCMAWQWYKYKGTLVPRDVVDPVKNSVTKGTVKQEPTHGICGMVPNR